MAKDKRSDEVFDAMLRKALKEEFMSSMDHLPSEESMKHKFSERHQKNMKDLFASDLQKDDHKADPRKTETDNVVRLYQELEVNQENNNEKRRWKKSRLWQMCIRDRLEAALFDIPDVLYTFLKAGGRI